MQKSNIYTTSFSSPIGIIWVGTGKSGVKKISLGNMAEKDFFSFIRKHYEEKEILTNDEFNKDVVRELTEYFLGTRLRFSVKLDIAGTLFQKKVWRRVREIPYGETATYGQVAEQIGNPKATRAVGGANNRNCIPIIIPCHRVIGKSGELVGYGGGLFIKRVLLEHEANIKDRMGSYRDF